MSDCVLSPASPSRNRVCSVWADKESRLSLTGRAFTCIRLGVQSTLSQLIGVFIYGLITVIHTQRIALQIFMHPSPVTQLLSLSLGRVEAKSNATGYTHS